MDKLKKIALVFALTMLGGLIWYLGGSLSPQQLQTALADFGIWAPLAYIALFAVLPAFFFPVAVLALAGGMLFGLWTGAVYTFIGAMINCTVMFFLSRTVGYAAVKAMVRRRLSEKWQQRLAAAGGKEGFVLLILLRLIPAVPYNLINYAFGLTEMSYPAYLAGSAIGIIPGTFVFINIGDKALDVASPGFWLAMGLLVVLLAVTTILGNILFKENKYEKQA